MCLSCTIEEVTGIDLSTEAGHDALEALGRIPWPDATPAMLECASYIVALHAHPDGGTGGPLHIVVDDDNVDDSNLAYCRGNIVSWDAYDTESPPETVDRARALSTWILDLLDPMSTKERAVTIALADGNLKVIEEYPPGEDRKRLRVWMPAAEFPIREDIFDDAGSVVGFQWGFKTRVQGEEQPA